MEIGYKRRVGAPGYVIVWRILECGTQWKLHGPANPVTSFTNWRDAADTAKRYAQSLVARYVGKVA